MPPCLTIDECFTNNKNQENRIMNQDISSENLKELERIGRELDEARSAKSAADLDLCAQYKIIKPILEKALPFIRLIPKFGKQIADAIEMLMGIADNFCPV